jgi:hypothetical protein
VLTSVIAKQLTSLLLPPDFPDQAEMQSFPRPGLSVSDHDPPVRAFLDSGVGLRYAQNR